MNAMTNIPNELFATIFHNLSRPELTQCLYVNRQWNNIAAQYYFETAILSNNQRAFLKSLLGSHNSTGQWVNKLIFKTCSSWALLDISEFQQMISYLPRLKIIQFNSKSCALKYLNYLLQTEFTHLNDLREIKLDIPNIKDDHTVYATYAQAMLKLSRTITHLTLENFAIDRFQNDENELISYLSEFTDLRSLSLSNRRGINIHNLDITAILETCPNLRNFEIRSYVNTCDNPLFDSTNSSNTLAVRTHRYLEKLHLSLCQLDPKLMNYMMTCIPATKSLFLRVYGTSFNDWTNDDIPVLEFAKYLYNYENFTMSMATGIVDNGIIPHAKPSELLRSSTNALWDFCTRIRGDRALFGDVIIELDHTRHVHLKPLVNVKDGRNLKLWTPLSKEAAYQWDTYFSSPENLLFINSLQINHSLDTKAVFELLDTLLKQCKCLKYLHLENKDESLLLGPSPNKLYLTHTDYRKEYQKDTTPVLASTTVNLTFASLHNVRVTKDMIRRLPKLLTLQLLQCKQSLIPLKQATKLEKLDILLEAIEAITDSYIATRNELENNQTLVYRCTHAEQLLVPVPDLMDTDKLLFTIQCPSSLQEISIRVPIKDTKDIICFKCNPYCDYTC